MTTNQKRANEYLNNVRTIQETIKAKELELDALRYKVSGAGGIDYSKDRIQTTPSNFMELAMVDIVEISKELDEDKALLEEIKYRAYSIIRKIKDNNQRLVLEWYYINDVNMTDVASNIYMSERNAYYLRDDALESFGMLLES